MAEKNNRKKLKHRGKGSATAGTSASAAPASTTPITSFFSRQPPSKLPCPLCGQLVPRFKINEHIDLQCLNFDRGDSSIAASADRSVVPSMQLSPRRSSTKSPEWDRSRGEEVEENQTSPYFKKNNYKSKAVVRTLDLGRLSSKLSTLPPLNYLYLYTYTLVCVHILYMTCSW